MRRLAKPVFTMTLLLVMDHDRGVALDEADSEKNRCDEERRRARAKSRVWNEIAPLRLAFQENTKRATLASNEKRREPGVAEHDDPMQLGLILERFALDEMFFSVAQSGSSGGEHSLGELLNYAGG